MCVFNGEMYHCDTARMFQKFDILNCNLGEENDGLLRGKRLCVDLGSNMLFSPKSGHRIVAPIREEHQMEVNKNTVEDIVVANRKLGRVYVAFEIAPGEYRFIDMTQMRAITVNNISSYNCSIINQKVRDRINLALLELQLSEDEFKRLVEMKGFVTPIPTETVEEVKVEEIEKVSLENNASFDIDKEALEETNVGGLEGPFLIPSDADTDMAHKIGKAITDKLPDNEKKLISLYSQVKGKKITKAEAAKQLGVSISAFNTLTKNMGKDKKQSKRKRDNTSSKYKMFVQNFYTDYAEGKKTTAEIAEELGTTKQKVYDYAYKYRKSLIVAEGDNSLRTVGENAGVLVM